MEEASGIKVGRKVLIKTDILEKFMEANEGRDLRDKGNVKVMWDSRLSQPDVMLFSFIKARMTICKLCTIRFTESICPKWNVRYVMKPVLNAI